MPQIITRGPGRVALFEQGAADDKAAASFEVQSFLTAHDGSKLFVTTPDSVDVYAGAEPSKKIASIPEAGVVLLALSPAGGYLVTCQKPSKAGESGEAAKNLKVWDLSAPSAPVLSLTLRAVSKDTWPALQWSGDDHTCALAVTNNVHVYSKADNFAAYKKCSIKGVSSIAICPAPASPHAKRLAAFVPEAKGSPASAALHDYTLAEPPATTKKAFFRTQGARLMWAASGAAVLVLSYADYDATNQSYYGEQKLHYLPADPAKADQATTVPLPKEGPVHDVQWSPAGDYFVTVAGFMPAKATLWDANCKPIYDFGSGPYNLVRWNPFGRFLALAGFGNLPGDILFFDKKVSGTCRQMGATRSPAVSAEWSPDGRHLLIATTAPRLRVDNNFKVLTYYGQQVAHVGFDTLFEAAWMPAPAGTFQDRPQSPERLAASAKAGEGGAAAGSSPAARPAGYRPPHLRSAGASSGTGGAPAPSFSLGFDANDKGGRIASARGGAPVASAAASRPGPAVPGCEFVETKTASKNAKKRANKNKKPGEGGAGGEGSGDEGPAGAAAAGVAGLSVSGGSQQAQQQGGEGGEGSEAEKKVRALQKKLRQIQQLKEKLAKEGPGALEPEQKQKIQTEGTIIEQIKALGGTV